VSLDLIIEIKKTSFPPCGIYGNQFYASLDPLFYAKLNTYLKGKYPGRIYSR
jgi:hypothetical protein